MKINPMCDLLVGNRPENDSDTQYYECEDCYRYEICKNYGCVEMCSIKEIKEATPNIIEPSYDSLKQEGYFEMSMISEQVKELRKLANSKEFEPHEPVAYGFYARIKSKLFKAADTIEALSAKLAAANMERSDRHYDVKKELVEQHNKAFELIKKMPLEGNEVWHGYVGGAMQTLGYLIDFVDKSDRHYGGGWQPISEYCRDKYDWVLIKYFDGEEECVPQVSELRSDGKWHVSTDFDGDFIIPPNFDVRYFFDMQQLDRR